MGDRFDKKLLGQIGLLTGMGVLLPAVGTAEASLICTTTQCTDTQTFIVTSSPNEVNDPGTTSNTDPQSTTATFSKFDPLLGTLTEIDFGLSSTLSGSISISALSNNSEGGASASGQTSWNAEYSLTMPGSVGFSDSKSDSVQCSQSGSAPNASCSDFKNPSFLVPWNDSVTLQSILDLYTGTGTLDATFDLDLMLSVFNEGNGESSASGGGSATWDPPAIDGLTVTYIFTPTSPVPEPGTLALLGMGAMAGLGFARRRLKPDR